MFGDSSPTKLGQICSSWRRIAHSTPHLWRTINLGSKVADGPSGAAAQLEVARLWIRRSGALALSVALQERNISFGDRDAALMLLCDARDRWEHAYIDLSWPDNSASRRLFHGDAPLLVQLHVVFEDGPISESHSLQAPRLRTALCTLRHTSSAVLLASMPWSQLTKILLDRVSLVAAVTVLAQAGAVVSCRLCLPDELAELENFRPPVLNLPNLTTFILEISTDVEISEEVATNVTLLLKAMRTPALTRLHVEEDALGEEPALVRAAVDAMECRGLEHLRVAYTHRPDHEVYAERFPQVATISLDIAGEFPDDWGQWSMLML
ncbi:F-box domain-containing protein [Mycena kentingensis (nom. inval.)]|nr:F-box domain-containing protein [Mycena kentingensis (nom. inval.)]